MTPEAYADKYLNLTWEYDKKSFQVAIRKYLAIDAKYCDQTKIDGSADAKQWLLDAIKAAPDVQMADGIIQVTTLKKIIPFEHIEKTFKGTASPSRIANTLWLATHLKFITVSPTDPTIAGREAARPQDYADWYLGMDCRGFANNYLGLNAHQRTVTSFDENKTTRRQTIAAIKMGDVMVKRVIASNSYEHIAIVVRVLRKSDTSMQLFTVESYGYKLAGIGRHDRNLIMTSPGIFVEQGAAKPAEIYIQPPPNQGPSL
ncbi:MAG TPA: hypothetical protein VF179_17115 [Thermoanaerobaculia bacterium]|nr:hypothetical protein [Thermoanaerobaculia bacterium]